MSTMTSAPAIAARRRLHDWLLAQSEPVTVRQAADVMGVSPCAARTMLRSLEALDVAVQTEGYRHDGVRMRDVAVWHAVPRLPTDLVPLRRTLQPATEALLRGATADEVAQLCGLDRGRTRGELHDMARHGYVVERDGIWTATPDG